VKLTLNWLKEHLDTDASVDTITEKLTAVGLEIESVTKQGAGLEGFVVGHVVEAKQHPNADRLRVCQVDSGSGVVEVVCGAPNARTGMKGVFARDGSYIPGTKITLKRSEIRGVVSNGMLLSEREMGLSDEHDGIIELPADAPIGAPAVKVMGLDDVVIDVNVTPNRGDCLGVRGIARDLAAAGLGKLKPLGHHPARGAFDSPIGVGLDFPADKASACSYFVGRTIRGVKNVDSPDWLKKRLLAVGLRPISALVDVTNFMTIAYGRPLHVFDADKVKGNLKVRLSRDGEKLVALNGEEYALDGEMTVIADDAGAEALGGVMGGMASGCTPETVNVFVESALFDPVRTATTGRKLNIISDARFRFERGIDVSFLEDGMEIATKMILDLCGGEPSRPVIAGREPDWKRQVDLRVTRLHDLGGLQEEPFQLAIRCVTVLEALGFKVETRGGVLHCQVPAWRNDIVGEADLVEEVVRIVGYDKVPVVPLPRATYLPEPAVTAAQKRRSQVRRTLASRGLVEAVTLSFMPSAQAELFGPVDDSVRLVNPISADLDVMRPSILPNLLDACRRNADRGFADCALFEIGPQFHGDAPEEQAMAATGVRAGKIVRRQWGAEARVVDVFDVKADAVAALRACGLPEDSLQTVAEAPAWYHPGHSGSLKLGPKVLARFGVIHPRVLSRMDVKGPVAGFEVLLDTLPPPKARKGAAKAHLELSPFQPVSRDFAFVVGEEVAADAVVRAARGADKALITEVAVFDVFSGGALGEGRKSIAIAVTLQSSAKTLTDAEIDGVGAKIVAAVGKATGGVLRT
jgi:phenylalanyl-tRNA synthetase beta chain